MPSHAAHLWFALSSLGITDLSDSDTIRNLNHGAQFPDMFYHNRRTRPLGLYVSVAIHRRGFASLSAHLLAAAASQKDWNFALAVLSHGVLDRRLHPWINAHTGWFDPANPDSWRYRHQHALCERMIDAYLCHKYRQDWLLQEQFAELWGPPPSQNHNADRSNEIPFPRSAQLQCLLSLIYPRCATDEELAVRFDNAWIDSRGYYNWTSRISADTYAEELELARDCYKHQNQAQGMLEDDSPLRFAALIHPRLDSPKNPGLREALEIIFEREPRPWYDPCHPGPQIATSLWGLWQEALEEMRRLIEAIGPYAGKTSNPAEILAILLQQGFGDGDLRSWQRETSACALDQCSPIDWFELWFRHLS